MDVIFTEKQKQIIRLSLWFLRKKLGVQGNAKQIQEEMENCSEDGIRNIAKLIIDNSMEIKSLSQRKVVIELSMLFLWIMIHDTAYRNIGFAILDDILYNAKELRTMIKPFVLPSNEWYANKWIDSQEITAKQREEGRIPDYAVSNVEAQCVPNLHRAELKRILNKMEKENE